MDFLVVFCSTLSCLPALNAYGDLARRRPGTGMAIMDFSRAINPDKSSEDSNKKALETIRSHYGIPVYFFGQNHLEQLIDGLSDQIPPHIVSLMRRQNLDYGWMRNKAYLLAMAAGAEAIQSFDIDTVPRHPYHNILDVHWTLLREPKTAAVSGNYFGPRAVTTSMFDTVQAQIKFLRLLREATTFDVLNPPVVGGVMAVNMSFAERTPFPMLLETTMSDDLLITYLASLMGRDTKQSGELVEHQHGGTLDPEKRMDPKFIPRYLRRIMRITALMTFLRNDEVRLGLRSAFSDQRDQVITPTVAEDSRVCEIRLAELLDRVSALASEERNNQGVLNTVEELKREVKEVARETAQGVRDYAEFACLWPTIVKAAKAKGEKWVSL